MFATAHPAAIQWGNALDQTSNAFQTCRAVAILMAITGNLDVPGGAIFPEGVPLLKGADFSLAGEIDPNRKPCIGSRILQCFLIKSYRFPPIIILPAGQESQKG